MSTEAAQLRTLSRIDSPWKRLPWTLPAALLVCALALWGLAYFMERSARQPVGPAPIDARFIELPPPAAAGPIRPRRLAAPRRSEPLPPAGPQQARKAAPENRHTEQNPAARKAEAAPGAIGGVALPAAPGDARAAPGEAGDSAMANPPAGSGGQTGSHGGRGGYGGSMYATSGARAIIRPMPQIPDDLREGAFSFAALARFHVAADGSTRVELARPTPNPRLNRIILDSLGKWRFMPAIKNGKPVASTEEIVIKIEVN